MKKDQKFGGNYLYKDVVKPNTDFGKFIDREGNVGDHKFIKLTFDDKVIKHAEGSRTVICKISCHIDFNIPFYWENGLTRDAYFNAKGIAICSDNDEFDINKGKAIASAKAEIEAYKIAKDMLATIQHQMEEFAKCVTTPMEKFCGYIEKNVEFIDKVVDGKIVIKIKQD